MNVSAQFSPTGAIVGKKQLQKYESHMILQAAKNVTSYAALINAQAKDMQHKKQPSLIASNATHHSKQVSVCSGGEAKTLTKQSHSHAALPKTKRLREKR